MSPEQLEKMLEGKGRCAIPVVDSFLVAIRAVDRAYKDNVQLDVVKDVLAAGAMFVFIGDDDEDEELAEDSFADRFDEITKRFWQRIQARELERKDVHAKRAEMAAERTTL